MKLCRTGSVTKALRFEFADPLLHAASSAIHLLIHVRNGDQWQFPSITFFCRVFGASNAGLNQTQVQLTGAAIKALSRDHTSGLIPAFGVPIRCSNDLRGSSGSRVALGLLALCVFEPLAVDGLLGSLDRWETHDVMGAQLLTGLDQGVGIEAGIRSQNNDVVGKCFLDPLEQPGQVVFKHLAGIAGACRAIHSNGVAMQPEPGNSIDNGRCKTSFLGCRKA